MCTEKEVYTECMLVCFIHGDVSTILIYGSLSKNRLWTKRERSNSCILTHVSKNSKMNGMSMQKILDFRIPACKMCKQMESRDKKDLTEDPLLVRFYVSEDYRVECN